MGPWQEKLVAGLSDSKQSSLPAWLAGLKTGAGKQFRTVGLPDKKTEQWKYTSLHPLETRAPSLGLDTGPRVTGTGAGGLACAGPGVYMVNGQFAGLRGELAPGLSVLPLAEWFDSEVPGLQQLLESLETGQKDQGFSALNTAMLHAGVLIRVAAGLDAGTVSLLWQPGQGSETHLFNSRVCVLLEPGSSLHLLEQYESYGQQASLLNNVLQAGIDEDARLFHTRYQEQSSDSFLVTRTEIQQSKNSRFHSTGVDIGSGFARHDVRSLLAGAGAYCTLNGVCVTGAASHTDHHLEAVHAAENCRSEQVFRAVAGGRSRVVFNGKVHIRPGADGADAHQSSAGLLLSALAEIDAKPELEIYADEVLANHGATIGQLDEQALFYLRSRGLDEDQASGLLTQAFCRSVTDQLRDEAVKTSLGERLAGKLEKAGV